MQDWYALINPARLAGDSEDSDTPAAIRRLLQQPDADRREMRCLAQPVRERLLCSRRRERATKIGDLKIGPQRDAQGRLTVFDDGLAQIGR